MEIAAVCLHRDVIINVLGYDPLSEDFVKNYAGGEHHQTQSFGIWVQSLCFILVCSELYDLNCL